MALVGVEFAKWGGIFQASDLQSERGAMQATDLQGPCGVAGVEYAK
jgi:hypothetical protein